MDDELRELRLARKIPAKEMVKVIQRFHPKFDKTMLSKCERGEAYGIKINRAALDALYAEFAPDMLPEVKRKRGGNHRFAKRAACRLTDDEYAAFQRIVQASDFDTMQDYLANMIRNQLKMNSEKNNL